MAIAPPVHVAAPTNAGAARYSIFDISVGPLSLPDDAATGAAYTVPWCGGGIAYDTTCEPPDLPAPDGLAIVTAAPFVVQQGFECIAAGGMTPALVEQYARERLQASEHRLVEEHVAGLLADSDPVVLGVVASVVDALAALEHYAYVTAGYGLQAVIHAPIAMAARFGADTLTARQSGARVSELNSLVYYNAGLPVDTAYVTGQVVLWRADAPWIGPGEATLNRATNRYQAIAQRDYAAGWECFSASVAVGPVGDEI